jgi:hypothetical protein
MKIKYIKHGYYQSNYPPGSVVEVEDTYAKYIIGMGDAEAAMPSDKITDPTPYVMKQRTDPADDALTMIANVLVQQQKEKTSGPEKKP